MVVRLKRSTAEILRNEEGQSLLEFLLLIPVMLGVYVLMVQTNIAIQTSIVSQKYARSQALFLSYNSAYYPELRFKQNERADFMALGVTQNNFVQGQQFRAIAVTHEIVRPGALDIGNDDPKTQPNQRGKVRIRNTVSLCTHSASIITPGGDFQFCRRPF